MKRRIFTIISFGLLTSLSSLAAAAPASNATEEEKRAAQKMFEAGDGLYESGRYDDAIVAFKNSHHLVASPNSRLMLARSLRESGRGQEACEEFRGTIKDAEASGGRYPEALQAAQSELKALEAQLSQASAAPPPETKPGTTSNNASANEANQKKPADAALVAPTAPSAASPATSNGALRTAAWIAAGVGVAGAGAFGVFGYLDRKTFDDLESACSHDRCSAASMDQVDTGRRYQLIANVGLGVAAVGAVAATTLFILSSGKGAERPQLALRASPGGILLDGRF